MNRKEANKIIEKHSAAFGALPREAIEAIEYLINAEPCRETDDYENEIADLQNRLDIAEYDRDRWKEKVTVLEEKLKSLSAEPCEDCISRQAARKIILDEFEGWPTDEEVAQLKRLTKQIDDLPSVTPKQKMGHWILDHVVCDVIYEYHCSACGHHLELGGRTIKQDQAEGYSLFCNGCGAKMVESEVTQDSDVYYEYLDQVKRYIKYANDYPGGRKRGKQ